MQREEIVVAIVVFPDVNYTANPGETVDSSTASSSITITLPGLQNGIDVTVKHGSPYDLTVATTSGSGDITGPGILAGTTSISVNSLGSFVTLRRDGTNWNVVAGAQDPGWITVTSFGAGWSAATPVRYRLTANVLRLDGIITGGASDTEAFNLPSGFRPQNLTYLPAVTNIGASTETPAYLNIGTDGSLVGLTPSAAAFGDTPLSSLTFTVD